MADDPLTMGTRSTTDATGTEESAEATGTAGTTGTTAPVEATGTTAPKGATSTTGTTDTPVLTAAKASFTTKIVTTAEFRARLSELLELANRQPITVASRGERARGVLVSPDFFDRACDALGEEPYARPPRSRLEEIMTEAAQILEFL